MEANRTFYSHDAEMRVMRDRLALVAICLLLGVSMGSVLALLFAPASGKRTRDELTHSLESGMHKGRERVEPAIAQLQHDIQDLRRKVDARLN